MKKYKKPLLIACAILFFLASLTLYLNRVLFPTLVKKIAIARIEDALKRKVIIESIHFNWVRGLVINNIKVFEKNSTTAVFAEAKQVSFGIIVLPGFKHITITIPFINVQSPSVHLIRQKENTWNFSDIYNTQTPPANPSTTTNTQPVNTSTAKSSPPSPVDINFGGIKILEGKFLLDDISTQQHWSEYFDHINLKLALSGNEMSYDFKANIPAKQGVIAAIVYYQPKTQNTRAQLHLKNIDTTSYLSLIKIPQLQLKSGLIDDVDLNINYTQEKISAQGNLLIKHIDITNNNQSFKGDISIRGLDATYQNGDIKAHGELNLNNIQTKIPDLDAQGSVQARVNDFYFTKEGVNFNGSLKAQHLLIKLKDRQVTAQDITLDGIKVTKDQNGIQSAANILTQGLAITWDNQRLNGDIALKNINLNMKDENDIHMQGDIAADHFKTTIDDKSFKSAHILIDNIKLTIKNKKDITLDTKLLLEDLEASIGTHLSIAGSLNSDDLTFSFIDGLIKVNTTLHAKNGKVVLDQHQTILASPDLKINLEMPLTHLQDMHYQGSLILSNAQVLGFQPLAKLDNINLDIDFKNNEAIINAFSINLLDSIIRATGKIRAFDKPYLNITAEADDVNLAKIKDLIPQIFNEYGLTLDGTTALKIKFEGLAASPLSAKIEADAAFKDVNASSSKFNQKIQHVTGSISATPNSIIWQNTHATYLNQEYTLSGTLENFKNPTLSASIQGRDIQLNANIVKSDDTITIKALDGKYFNVNFTNKGTILVPPGQKPSFDLNCKLSLVIEDLIKKLPDSLTSSVKPLKPTGTIALTASVKGRADDWKNYTVNASVTSPLISLLGYKLNNMAISFNQDEGRIKNLIFDGNLYAGTVHVVGSMDLNNKAMPYDLALNIDNTDLHLLKMDSPMKMDEINGKFYLTTLAHGTVLDFKNTLHATGSMAVRDGFLAQFNIFKGILTILNDAMRLGQVLITDIEGNFTIDNQKINTDNLRLKGPTVVLLTKGWVNFDQMCNLDVSVDLSSGIVPDIAHDVLNSLNIHIYDNIANPKFNKKISVPQVLNTLLKNFLQ